MIETANHDARDTHSQDDDSKGPPPYQEKRELTKKTVEVLSLIARGLSYDQIVKAGNGITYPDIFEAAAETLREFRSSVKFHERLEKIKKKHPNAYKLWSTQQEKKLVDLFEEKKSVEEIAEALGRQPTAIQARLVKLGLAEAVWA